MKRFPLVPIFVLLVVVTVFAPSCNNDDDGGGLIENILFPVEKDIELGEQLDSAIKADPETYPLLSETEYPEAYGHIRRIRDSVLKSSEIDYRDEFVWEVNIIHDDNTLNAFAAPGGYIYVYTGLIKYLESEDELAGVMGHEIAHADRRHSINQLKKQYSLQFLLNLTLGENQGVLSDVAAGLISLSNSRADEREADEYSVRYLCETSYNAAGAAGFFEKIEAEGSSSPPEFLSTHPNPENRVEDIYGHEETYDCQGTEKDAQYAAILASLP